MELTIRNAKKEDAQLLFQWANDPVVRSNSYQQSPIELPQHLNWLNASLSNPDCNLYIFEHQGDPVGQVKINLTKSGETIIGISIDSAFRGKSLGKEMIRMAIKKYEESHHTSVLIYAYIKEENVSSYQAFLKAGFQLVGMVEEQNILSYKMAYSS